MEMNTILEQDVMPEFDRLKQDKVNFDDYNQKLRQVDEL